ncbi:AP4S1 [Acanthosepion pharaonis]|uniref:AP4S1 n=1 Tax=Acanthosepion pharaonis TaxID=158019 RepID=A0A812D1U4_ACAPH|nr:AP4S1 [Sepia pharaonis]
MNAETFSFIFNFHYYSRCSSLLQERSPFCFSLFDLISFLKESNSNFYRTSFRIFCCEFRSQTMIKFLLIVNKAGRLRLTHYFEHYNHEDKSAIERDIIRRCLSSSGKQCTFWEYRDFTIVYRKYVNLYFVSGITNDENELAVLELMHNLLETLNVYFSKVSELDVSFFIYF